VHSNLRARRSNSRPLSAAVAQSTSLQAQTRHYLGSLESAAYLGAILGDPLDLSI